MLLGCVTTDSPSVCIVCGQNGAENSLSPGLQDIVSQCVQGSSFDTLTASELLQHDVFKKDQVMQEDSTLTVLTDVTVETFL